MLFPLNALVFCAPCLWMAAQEPAALAPQADSSLYEKSVALVRAALERRPQDASLFRILGDVHQRGGRFREAIEAFQSASRLQPNWGELVLRLGEVYSQMGEHERAIEAYRRLLAMGSARVPARMGLAEIFYQTGRHAEAVEQLKAALAEPPSGVEVHYLLGRALDAQARAVAGQPAARSAAVSLEREALHALEEAVRIDPSHAQAHYILGMIFQRQGKADRARTELEAFRRLKPVASDRARKEIRSGERLFEAQTALQLARAALEAGDAPRALEYVRNTLRQEPDILEARAFEGWIHLKLDRVAEAARAYQDVLQKDPNHAESLWNLGKIQLKAGRLAQAAPLLLRATEIQKSFPEGWELLARLAVEEGVYAERAEEFAQRALQLRESAANRARLAMALHAAGKTSQCEKVILEALKRYPDDPDLRIGLETVRQEGTTKR